MAADEKSPTSACEAKHGAIGESTMSNLDTSRRGVKSSKYFLSRLLAAMWPRWDKNAHCYQKHPLMMLSPSEKLTLIQLAFKATGRRGRSRTPSHATCRPRPSSARTPGGASSGCSVSLRSSTRSRMSTSSAASGMILWSQTALISLRKICRPRGGGRRKRMIMILSLMISPYPKVVFDGSGG